MSQQDSLELTRSLGISACRTPAPFGHRTGAEGTKLSHPPLSRSWRRNFLHTQMCWGHSGRTKRSGGVVRSDGSTTAQPQTGSGTSRATRERGQGSANAWALWDKYSLAGWDTSGWMWMFVMALLERVTPALLQSPQKDMVSFRLCPSPPELDVPDELYFKTTVSLHCLEKKLKVLSYQKLILELLTKKGEVGESPWMILQSTCLKIFFKKLDRKKLPEINTSHV